MNEHCTYAEKALFRRICADERYVKSSLGSFSLSELTDEEIVKFAKARDDFLAGLTNYERRIYQKVRSRGRKIFELTKPASYAQHLARNQKIEEAKKRVQLKRDILHLIATDPAFRQEMRMALYPEIALTPPAPALPPPAYSEVRPVVAEDCSECETVYTYSSGE